MKPVLIQTLHRHNQNKKPKHLDQVDIDHAHGGHKDRSGFIVVLIILISTVIALVIS